MAQSKTLGDKGKASSSKGAFDHTAWQEQQHKYTQTAKEAFEKFSDHLKSLKPDHAKVMDNHKKNLEALNDANKMAAEVMKSLASLQNQFVKQTFEDLNAMMRSMMTQKPGQPADLSVHSEIMQGSLQRAMDHAKNVSSVLSSSGQEIHARVNQRFDEVKEVVKEHIAKHQKH